jgi:hypothetical protein
MQIITINDMLDNLILTRMKANLFTKPGSFFFHATRTFPLKTVVDAKALMPDREPRIA